MRSVEEVAAWINHGLRCPMCAAEQLECTDRAAEPTQWRCRECKQKFEVKGPR